MLKKSFFVFLATFLVSSVLWSQPNSGKKAKNSTAKKMTYQQAKKACLSQDAGLVDEDLKYCILQKRSKTTKKAKR